MSFGSERERRVATSTSEEKKKELRRVYRKLKGVRSQISMKMKELKKEVWETDFPYDDEQVGFTEMGESAEEDLGDARSRGEQEPKKKGGPIATQFELKMLVDHKAKLRKRFQELQDEVQNK